MSHAATPHRSRVPWALAVTVGLCSGLAGYVIHAARVNRIPKQVVTVKRLTDMAGSEEIAGDFAGWEDGRVCGGCRTASGRSG